MKLITAIIQPYRLKAVRNALSQIGIHGVTIIEVRGAGHQKGYTELYRGAKTEVTTQPKVQLSVAIQSQQLDLVVDTIVQAARTGEIGDGKIFVTALEQVIRIRTGETGDAAL